MYFCHQKTCRVNIMDFKTFHTLSHPSLYIEAQRCLVIWRSFRHQHYQLSNPSIWQTDCWGRFKKAYVLLNLRALKIHPWMKCTSFIEWVRYFVCNFKGDLWKSTQNILPIHWKTEQNQHDGYWTVRNAKYTYSIRSRTVLRLFELS